MSLRGDGGSDLLSGLPEGLRALNAPALARAGVLDQVRLEACPTAERPGFVRALASHARQGRLARDAGAALEGWLSEQHREALRRGVLARMAHVGPPVAWVGHGRQARPVPTGPGPADYQGQLPGGRSVAVEAKSCEGRLARSAVTPSQSHDLEACARGGGLAALVWEHRAGGVLTRYAIPWREVPWRSVRRGAGPSVGPEDVARWRVGEGLYLAPLVGGS